MAEDPYESHWFRSLCMIVGIVAIFGFGYYAFGLLESNQSSECGNDNQTAACETQQGDDRE